MNLLTATNRYYIFIALSLVLGATSYIMFRVVHFTDAETREHMLFEKELIIKQLNYQPELLASKIMLGDFVEISPVNKLLFAGTIFKDTAFYDSSEFEVVPFTQLSTILNINGKLVLLKIRRRLTEHEDVFAGITIPFGITGVLVILSFLILNFWFSKTKLKPFHTALAELKKFDVAKNYQLQLENTNITEFNSLNKELLKLTGKVKKDYQNLKEFTENVSHEAKVPIAVVQSRLELLLQSSNLSSSEKNQISSALDTIQRLNDKNNALYLFSKIESSEYITTHKINLNNLLDELLVEMDDFIKFKKINLEKHYDTQIIIDANDKLIEILFTNLLSNAIKYNIDRGKLSIHIMPNKISISNSGDKLMIPHEELFDRYTKGRHSDSSGLGLSIAKKICALYHFNLTYENKNDIHIFVFSLDLENK